MMTLDVVSDVVSRVIHIGMAVVLVGGSVFMRFVLLPAAAELPEAEHKALRGRLLARWRKFVGIGIGLLLLSGFYNYIKVAIPMHKGDGLYHGLMGVKIILALLMFFIASALSGRSEAFDKIRQHAKTWLAVLIVLAAILITIAGFLKVRGGGSAMADEVSVVDVAKQTGRS